MKKYLVFLVLVSLLLTGCAKKEKETDIFEYIQTLDNLEDYIIIGNYKGITVATISVTEKDVAKFKQDSQNKYAYFKPIEDKTRVEVGDNVNISYVSYLDNKAFDGGSGEADLVVGDGTFMFSSVETALIGLNVGSECSVQVLIPNDYFSIGLRGKTVTMKVTVNRIQEKEKTLPEINDEFVKEHFDLDSAKDFDAYVWDTLEKQAENTMMENAWKAALSNCEMIRYPDGIIEKYVKEMYDYYTELAAEYGAGPELYIGDDLEAWKAEATEYAEDYYKSEIAMYCILDREYGRKVSDSEYAAKLKEYAEDMGVTEKELEKVYSKNDIITSIHWDKVMDCVWNNRTPG